MRRIMTPALNCAAILTAGLLLAASPVWAQTPPNAEKPEGTEQYIGYDIVDLYDQAKGHLEKICDDYRRIKAMELSRMRNLPFEEAFDNVSSVMPVLVAPNRELLRRSIRNPKDIQTHKTEVNFVQAEVENMIALAAELLLEIEKIQMEMMQALQEMQEKTLEEIVEQEAFDPELEPLQLEDQVELTAEMQDLKEAAKEDEEQPMKDLTALMRPMMQKIDMKDLTQEEQEEGEPADLFKSSNDMAGIMSIADFENVNHGFGRKITAGAPPVEWLFVNSWYTIGPFPNPERRNINKKFPPETVVDLNASYDQGLGGQTVKWEFVTSSDLVVQPANPAEYAIFYAYTEVYCDRPMDLWVAVGSDDKGSVWLNDLPIWISGDELKSWKANEGYRKVSFKKGINKILYRVENGRIFVLFSLAIRVAP